MPSGELLRVVLAAVDPAEARQRADEILAQPEFRPPEPTFLERIFEWIGERLGDVFSAVGQGAGNTVVAVVLIGALLAVIGLLAYRASTQSGRVGRTGGTGDAVLVEVEERRSVTAWLDLAREHEAAGEWREALRCRYRALVGGLIERRLLRDVPGRTAGEFRRELATTAPAVAAPFADASELFEEAWYGNRPTGPEESTRFQTDARRVEEA